MKQRKRGHVGEGNILLGIELHFYENSFFFQYANMAAGRVSENTLFAKECFISVIITTVK